MYTRPDTPKEITMPRSNSRSSVRARLLGAFLFTLSAPAAFPSIVESSPFLPPANGVYYVPNACISVVCLENTQIKNFVVTSSLIQGGNEVTVSNVDLTASLYQNISGSPGAFISPLVLTGQVDITYFSKPGLTGTGTFNDQITSLDLSGSFTGLSGTHTIVAMLNPHFASTGQTTVQEIPGKPTTWRITSFFDVFAELSVDGGTPVPGPERMGDLGAAPEPSYYIPIGVGLLAIVVRRVTAAKRLAIRSEA
jgi:hypothetical protein